MLQQEGICCALVTLRGFESRCGGHSACDNALALRSRPSEPPPTNSQLMTRRTNAALDVGGVWRPGKCQSGEVRIGCRGARVDILDFFILRFVARTAEVSVAEPIVAVLLEAVLRPVRASMMVVPTLTMLSNTFLVDCSFFIGRVCSARMKTRSSVIKMLR